MLLMLLVLTILVLLLLRLEISGETGRHSSLQRRLVWGWWIESLLLLLKLGWWRWYAGMSRRELHSLLSRRGKLHAWLLLLLLLRHRMSWRELHHPWRRGHARRDSSSLSMHELLLLLLVRRVLIPSSTVCLTLVALLLAHCVCIVRNSRGWLDTRVGFLKGGRQGNKKDPGK